MPPNDRDPTHDRDSLERRLDAVERALAADEPLERADRLDDLETRVAELEAAVQALRGYVGSVRAVNEDVERRADRAFRKARAVERVVTPPTRTPDASAMPTRRAGPIPTALATGTTSTRSRRRGVASATPIRVKRGYVAERPRTRRGNSRCHCQSSRQACYLVYTAFDSIRSPGRRTTVPGFHARVPADPQRLTSTNQWGSEPSA